MVDQWVKAKPATIVVSYDDMAFFAIVVAALLHLGMCCAVMVVVPIQDMEAELREHEMSGASRFGLLEKTPKFIKLGCDSRRGNRV